MLPPRHDGVEEVEAEEVHDITTSQHGGFCKIDRALLHSPCLSDVCDHLHKDTPNSVVSKYGGSTLNLAGALCIWRENFEEFG